MDSEMAGPTGSRATLSGVARSLGLAGVICLAWIGAWILEQFLEPRVGLLASASGRTVYWTAMRLVVWVLPSVVVIRLSGLTFRQVMRFDRGRSIMVWGGGVGLILGAISLLAKTLGGQPLFSSSVGLPLISAVFVASAVEEIAFRGAILGGLQERFRFWRANLITGLLFVGIHCPGWFFQGCLVTRLTSPVNGALSIFLLGLVFGYVAHKSKSVAASTLTHMVNNLFSG